MQQVLETTLKIRKMILELLQSHNLEQLNKIPEGFNNNLLWNVGHILVAQQVLVYKLSGLPMIITNEMVDKYKNGSKPEQDLTQTEVDAIQNLLLYSITKTELDYNNGIFKDYSPYTTSIGLI